MRRLGEKKLRAENKCNPRNQARVCRRIVDPRRGYHQSVKLGKVKKLRRNCQTDCEPEKIQKSSGENRDGRSQSELDTWRHSQSERVHAYILAATNEERISRTPEYT